LIERDKIRYLADRHHRENANHHRIRVDISHFDISHIYKENSHKLSSPANDEQKEDLLLKSPIRIVGRSYIFIV